MAKIGQITDLPEWFKLENYQPCKSFTAAQWFYQLERRADVFSIHPDYMRTERVEDDLFRELTLSIWKSSVSRWVEPIRRSPINLDRPVESVSAPICELTIRDLWMQAHIDEIAKKEKKHDKTKRWECITGNTHYTHWLEHQGDFVEIDSYQAGIPPAPALKINMQASDSVLIEAFSSWLKNARKSQKFITNKREKPAYKDWARYGLLPYIDLMTWAKENDHQITYHLLSEAVGYVKGGDSFRKTVPKLADDLLRNLSELEALAAIELPEKPSH